MMFDIGWGDPYTYAGMLGVTLLLFGFWRTSIGRWTNKSPMYELDTVAGASLVIAYQLHVHAYITLPINIVLVIISFRGLTSYAERSRERKARKLRRRKR